MAWATANKDDKATDAMPFMVEGRKETKVERQEAGGGRGRVGEGLFLGTSTQCRALEGAKIRSNKWRIKWDKEQDP